MTFYDMINNKQSNLLPRSKSQGVKLALFSLTLLLISQASFAEVPIPSDIKIIPPDNSLPANLKCLSGVLRGVWVNLTPTRASGYAFSRPGRQEAVIVVESITLDEVIFIYAWGDCLEWMSTKGWRRRRSPILNKDGYPGISYTILNSKSHYYNSKLLFFLNKEGNLRGEHSKKYGLDILLRKER